MLTSLATAVLAATLAAGSSVSLDPAGDWSTGRANVGGSATCSGGTGTVSLTVRDPGTGTVLATGSTLVACDGRAHSWAGTVFGPIPAPGSYPVTASLPGTQPATRLVDLR
jgi:hypothetical protein